MLTLNDYIQETLRRESRFLNAPINGRYYNQEVNIANAPFVFVSKDGKTKIPCHNKVTLEYYKRKEEVGDIIK